MVTNLAYKHEPFTARPCFWRHRWPKWCDVFQGRESFGKDSSPDADGYPVVIQERRCPICNKLERRIVRVE